MRDKTSRAHFYAFLGALLLCLVLVGWMVAPYLLSLFFGGLLALVTRPVYARLARRMRPWLAAALCTLLMLALVIGPATGFTIAAVREGVAAGKDLSELREFTPGELTRRAAKLPVVRSLGEPEEIAAKAKSALQALGAFASRAVLKMASAIPPLLLQLLLALVAYYFFLVDGPRFVDFALSRTAWEDDVKRKLRRTIKDTASATVLAGLAAAASQAALIFLGYLALGVPGAFLAGGATFLLAWLPAVGSLPASIAGVVYLYSRDETGRMIAMIAVGCGAGVIDNLVRPLVLKGRNDLHPLVGLVSIIAGIDMFGILGLFIGPLLAALAVAMLELWPEIGARYGVDVAHDPR